MVCRTVIDDAHSLAASAAGAALKGAKSPFSRGAPGSGGEELMTGGKMPPRGKDVQFSKVAIPGDRPARASGLPPPKRRRIVDPHPGVDYEPEFLKCFHQPRP